MFFQRPTPSSNAVVSIPAPVGGLNARDSVVAMPEGDAIVMRNWWPQPYGCSVRKGYRQWATGMVNSVHTLQEWSGIGGTRKLFAWSGTNMYDISTSGAVGAPILTSLIGQPWVCTQVTNTSGSNMIALNGLDNGIIYNVSGGIARLVAGDGIVTNTWAGINPANATQPIVHQHRLWVVEKNSTAAWFLPPDAIQGTFLKYDFGPLFNRGGYLAFLATWTIDDGNGAEDHLVALSSNGEAIVYGGTDPTNDTLWGLVGVYFIGSPVSGKVGFCKAGGDLLALTQQGVVSLSAQLVSTKVKEANNPLTSNKIQYLISEAISLYSQYAGWDLKYYPRVNMVLVNVPSVVAGGTAQFAANQITSAWTLFSGMDSSVWGNYDTNPMFGTYDGNVMLAWTGELDGVLLDNTGGQNIITEVQQAYTYFGKLATQKQVSMYKPSFINTLPIAVAAKIEYDFAGSTITVPSPVTLTGSTPLWDTAVWDTALWGGGSEVQKSWIQGEGMGVACSLRMMTQSTGECIWVATDYSVVSGSGLF